MTLSARKAYNKDFYQIAMPALDTLANLCKVIDISPAYILYFEEDESGTMHYAGVATMERYYLFDFFISKSFY